MGLPAISSTTERISIFFSNCKDSLKTSAKKINEFILKHSWPLIGASYLLSKYLSIQEGVYFALPSKIVLAFSTSLIILKLALIIKDRFFNKKDKDDNAAKDSSSSSSESHSAPSVGREGVQRMGATINSYADSALKPPAERRIWDID